MIKIYKNDVNVKRMKVRSILLLENDLHLLETYVQATAAYIYFFQIKLC